MSKLNWLSGEPAAPVTETPAMAVGGSDGFFTSTRPWLERSVLVRMAPARLYQLAVVVPLAPGSKLNGCTCDSRSRPPPPPELLPPTTRITATLRLELPDLICTTHVYMPAGNPVAYADTLTLPVVVPAEGVTETHELPNASAVKLIPVLLPVTVRFCGA